MLLLNLNDDYIESNGRHYCIPLKKTFIGSRGLNLGYFA